MSRGKEPSGYDLLKTLVDLYADQMGVQIKYEIIEKEAKKDA